MFMKQRLGQWPTAQSIKAVVLALGSVIKTQACDNWHMAKAAWLA